MRPLFFYFFIILIFSGCKKDEIHNLKKGKWNIEWTNYAPAPYLNPQYTYKGKLHFKSGGKGVYFPAGKPDKVPFNYSISGSAATFQFYNPNYSNDIHKFDIVISEDDYQVWEENSIYQLSTFVIKK
jgi:hypothetical protein